MPLPEHAPAASPTSGNTVMSWHWLVRLVLCVPGPWSPPFQSPAMFPVSSAKMRGRLMIFAVCGAAICTSITSMLKRAVLPSFSGSSPEQPSSSSPDRTEPVPEP